MPGTIEVTSSISAEMLLVTPFSNECSRNDTKPSDGEAPVLELSEMLSNPLLPLLLGLL